METSRKGRDAGRAGPVPIVAQKHPEECEVLTLQAPQPRTPDLERGDYITYSFKNQWGLCLSRERRESVRNPGTIIKDHFAKSCF